MHHFASLAKCAAVIQNRALLDDASHAFFSRPLSPASQPALPVYKIDRLTRSLADFAKLVERLERAGASFVSVTQSFNTATSMGRLTLNVLLSFAQFEREVTAERIRDKLAASKRKGLWMGGAVPLGYAKDERSLKIVAAEAETVKRLYALYLEEGSLLAVKARAQALGLSSRERAGKTAVLGSTHIHYILTNPTYAGMIRHRGKTFAGHHPAIIDPQLFDQVQEKLKAAGAFERGPWGRPPRQAPSRRFGVHQRYA